MIRRNTVLLLILLLAGAAASPSFAQDAERRKGFSIRITAPKDQEPVFGKTRIAAKLKMDEPEFLDRVEFLVGDQVVFVDREAPFECTYDFGKEPKAWIIRAVAYHKEGPTVSDAVITRKLRAGLVQTEEVNRVLLWITVTDREDTLITDLHREEFTVFEDGKKQKILEFYLEDRPISLAILLDSSGSMQDAMEEIHKAAGSFVDTLRPEDQALVIDFDERVFLVQDLTPDHDALKEAITTTEAIGGTALYDALHAAYRKLRDIQGRKAIVLLSDGVDSASQLGFKRVLEEAKSNNVMIFAIGMGNSFSDSSNRQVLKEFSSSTGGRSFFIKRSDQLGGIYRRIAEELRTQYFLTYSTAIQEWNGHWVKLKAVSSDPSHKVRARKGFFAVPRKTD